MRHGVESQGRLKQLSIELQELARVCRACIGDDKADVEVIRCRHQLFKKAVVREVDHDRAILNAKVFCDSTPNFFQSVKPPGNKHNVKPTRSELPCELPANSRRCPGHDGPRAELFLIDECAHSVPLFRNIELMDYIVKL